MKKEESPDIVELTLTFDWPMAAVETNRSQSSSLLRPLRRIAEEGKPTGTINYLFFRDGDALHVLGSLCYSPEGLVLFFPGVLGRSLRSFTSQGDTLRGSEQLGIIDHLTLEPGFKRGHITTSLKRLKYRMRFINGDGVFWFAMSLKSCSVLEPLCRSVEFSFVCPPSDSKRRIDDIMSARQNAVIHIVSLPEDKEISDTEYLHFQFFLGSEHNFGGGNLLGLPPVRESDVNKGRSPVRAHPVILEGLEGRVWVIASTQSGKLAEDALFATIRQLD